ncbi:MAG: helix-turn-helix domain-containing protein [Anaerolineae bacterium]|nr:helix-turn-helix domain-containing protein [Anaerolineae bacterium]
MTVKVTLKQFIREYEAAHQCDLTWADIKRATGIADGTLDRLLNGKSQRVDLEVLDKLCKFLDVKSGPIPFIIYQEDGPA